MAPVSVGWEGGGLNEGTTASGCTSDRRPSSPRPEAQGRGHLACPWCRPARVALRASASGQRLRRAVRGRSAPLGSAHRTRWSAAGSHGRRWRGLLSPAPDPGPGSPVCGGTPRSWGWWIGGSAAEVARTRLWAPAVSVSASPTVSRRPGRGVSAGPLATRALVALWPCHGVAVVAVARPLPSAPSRILPYVFSF